MKDLADKFKTYLLEARFAGVITTFIVLGLRLALFLQRGLPEYEIGNSSFAWKYISVIFNNSWISFIGGTISVFIIAASLSQLNLRYGIIRIRTSLPYILPLILFSSHPFFLIMSPSYISILFILWAFFPLLDSGHKPYPPQTFAFQAAVFLSLASIFQIYALLLLPFWWIGQRSLSNFNFKTFFASLWGILLVFWIVFALFVFGDNLSGFIIPFIELSTFFSFEKIPTFSIPQWGFIISLILFVVLYVTLDNRYRMRDKAFSQKVIFNFILIICFCLIFQTLYFSYTLFWLYLMCALLSFILSHYYMLVQKKWEVFSFFIMLFILLFLYLVNYFTNSSPF